MVVYGQYCVILSYNGLQQFFMLYYTILCCHLQSPLKFKDYELRCRNVLKVLEVYRIRKFRFRVQGLGLRVHGLGLRVQGLEFRLQGS